MVNFYMLVNMIINMYETPPAKIKCMQGGFIMDIAIAKKQRGTGLISRSVKLEEGAFESALVRDGKSSVKKLKRYFEDKCVLVEKNTFTKDSTLHFVKEYKTDIFKEALCILPSVVLSTAQKYKLNTPIKEIYIMAAPVDAIDIIMQIKNMSRLFTVVSQNDDVGKIYDELYFKYGTVIRHIPSFGNADWDNSIVIKYDALESVFPWIKAPIISFDEENAPTEKLITLREVSITGNKIEKLCEALNQKGGLYMYSILSGLPEENCKIDINSKCDKMFFLDISAI